MRSRLFYLIIPFFLAILSAFLFIYSAGTTREFKLKKWVECSDKKKCENVQLPGSSRRGENNIVYKTNFLRPEFCHNEECVLIIGEIADSASIYLNGALIAKHGDVGTNFKYLRHYPFSTDLRNIKDSNELIINVYSPQTNQIGIRLDPISIFDKNSGMREKNFILFKKILLPLFSFFSLVIVALLIFIYAIFLNVNQGDLGLKIIFFCLSSSLYMLSITQIPLEVIRIDIATNIHFFLRFLEVFALFVCYQGVLDKKNRILYVPYFIMLSLPVIQLIKILFSKDQNISENYQYTYVLVKNLFILYLLPHLFAMYYFAKSRKWGDFLFISLYALMQIWDTLIFHNIVTGQFTLKFNLIIISVYFSIKFFSSEKNIWERIKSQQALAEQATQLAHDIRSPIEVLKSITKDLGYLPSESRERIQMGIERIEEISKNLLSNYLLSNNKNLEFDIIQPSLLFKKILAQKSIEFPNVDFIFNDNSSQHSQSMVKVVSTDLKTIISNLINNGVEASRQEHPKIMITINETENYFNFLVADEGLGISAGNLNKIFSKGFSTKQKGHGLGLYHAREKILNWGGEIDCTSCLGSGTTFSIKLLKQKNSSLDTLEINLENIHSVIILDDDPLFHNLWAEKLDSFDGDIKYFFDPDNLLQTFSMLPPQTLLLCDLELGEKKKDGLSVIKSLNSIDSSILVTAKGFEELVRSKCRDLGIRLLPKSQISNVVVLINSKEVILIDDDKLNHILWRNHFKTKNEKLTTYFSVESFLINSAIHPHDSIIVVDSKIGDDLRGEIESEKIYNLGFKKIIISTAFEAHHIQKMPWITKVIDKNPKNLY